MAAVFFRHLARPTWQNAFHESFNVSSKEVFHTLAETLALPFVGLAWTCLFVDVSDASLGDLHRILHCVVLALRFDHGSGQLDGRIAHRYEHSLLGSVNKNYKHLAT